MFVVYVIVLVIVFYFFEKSFESFQTLNKIATKEVPCPNCIAYNFLDTRTKCEAACRSANPDKNINFTGKVTKDGDKIKTCQCDYKGKLTQSYVGCPNPSSLGGNDCFIFTNDDAKKMCPSMCNKYLIGKNSRWTGDYKRTSTHTSACECEYID